MDEKDLKALTQLELRETELLAWGAVGAEWTEEEILDVFSTCDAGKDVFDRLVESFLIVRTPNNGYRSRSAETVRLLATLRQSFRHGRVTEGRPLILDHRFLHRPRRRPSRNIPASDALGRIRASLDHAGYAAARLLMPDLLSGFQERSTRSVLSALNDNRAAGVMITAGTGSGKTLAFYLPLLSWLADNVGSRTKRATVALALYPRNELLKDQLRAILEYLDTLSKAKHSVPALSLSTWFGQTPGDSRQVKYMWSRRGRDFVCPYLRCLRCDGDLVWRAADLLPKSFHERLTCTTDSCDATIDSSVLRLTRESAQQNPADLMLTTTESLNRQLSAPGNLEAFGILPATLCAVLLDEVHTYEGPTGAQNALLFRRLRHALGRSPVWVGLSATLHNAGGFFARLVNLPPSAVAVVQPRAQELEESGAEYLVALRHNPHSQTGPLSATIQTSMALTRCLDNLVDDPFDPAPSSGGVFGSKVFVFTDKLDSTNRLYWDLSEAEGQDRPRQNNWQRPRTLAHLRSQDQQELASDHQEPTEDREPDGQWWWLAEQLGYGLDADRSLRIGRTSSQDRGVSNEAQVVVATATLEVGFDDDKVGAVIQHKAPHDAAQFLQRKGRAGRKSITRPWTIVVLSDWGRDRQAWDAYDALFDPVLPARNLPIENFYVLRIQAVYSLLDWLARELRYTRKQSTWTDLAGPAAALHPDYPGAQESTRKRQRELMTRLERLLRPGPERNRLRQHLLRALALGDDEYGESVVDSILWDSPRPLLLAVVPTIRRQLAEQWRHEEPAEGDVGLQTRTPLRKFVPGNLFDDLLVPDVELDMPGLGGKRQVEHLPALRALREFCPGNVSRHFGIFAENKRHWLPIPDIAPGEPEPRIDVRDTYNAELVDTIDVGSDRVTVYAPRKMRLEAVDPDVKDSSSVQPDWEFHVTELGKGREVILARSAKQLLSALTAHLHVQGGGVRTIRFARTARGTMWDPAARPVDLAFGTGGQNDWIPAAIGVDVYCDAIEGSVAVPAEPGPPTATERTARLRHILMVEASLPDEISVFTRDQLFEIVTLAFTRARFAERPLLDDSSWSGELIASARILGVLPSDHGTSVDDSALQDHWFTDATVLAAVRSAVSAIEADERDPQWLSWWRRSYTLSVAHLVRDALAARCPGIDTDELQVDLSPDQDDRFWLSERSPGGTGQIEAFQRALTEDPDAFGRTLEDALRPTAVETADEELTRLIRTDSDLVRNALETLRQSWRDGHTAAATAVREVERVAWELDTDLGGPARSALSTRIAGPGAHPDLIRRIASWLELREEVSARTQLAVDSRTLGALVSDDDSLDEVLHLGTEVTAQRRARAVANVLWPWGRTPPAPSAAYQRTPETSVAMVRSHVHMEPDGVDITDWDEASRSAIHRALIDGGELNLRARHANPAVLRSALLDLQVHPVEVDTLLCHPVIVGLRKTTQFIEARVLLREAM